MAKSYKNLVVNNLNLNEKSQLEVSLVLEESEGRLFLKVWSLYPDKKGGWKHSSKGITLDVGNNVETLAKNLMEFNDLAKTKYAKLAKPKSKPAVVTKKATEEMTLEELEA